MTAPRVYEAALEFRRVVETMRGKSEPHSVGPVVVSGMLGDQLARELGRGAEANAVVTGDGARLRGASLAIHVIAADPTEQDEALVRVADELGVPVLLVQLWPQADWTPPFVLTPFVVECRAGEGFPVPEIAARLFEASPGAGDLARRIPAVRDVVEGGIIERAVARAAIVGALGSRFGSSRPLLVLEQAQLMSQLRALNAESIEGQPIRTVSLAACALGLGLALRSVARSARGVLPGPVTNAAVAAVGTWTLGRTVRRLDAHL